MFKKIIFTITILLFFSLQFIAAQSDAKAEKVLSDLLNSVKTSAVKTDFRLALKEKPNSIAQNVSGVFTLKGTKFVLEMDAMKAYFDGKTQWAYIAQNNEVSITQPSEKELSQTNPMAILSGYRSKSIIQFSDTPQTLQNYCIEMLPKIKSQDVVKIEVQVNKSTNNLVSIKLTNKNGSSSLLTLSNIKKNIPVSDDIFVFNAAKYKKLVVNDLR